MKNDTSPEEIKFIIAAFGKACEDKNLSASQAIEVAVTNLAHVFVSNCGHLSTNVQAEKITELAGWVRDLAVINIKSKGGAGEKNSEKGKCSQTYDISVVGLSFKEQEDLAEWALKELIFEEELEKKSLGNFSRAVDRYQKKSVMTSIPTKVKNEILRLESLLLADSNKACKKSREKLKVHEEAIGYAKEMLSEIKTRKRAR